MTKCPKCGKEIPKESSFCPYCMEKFIVGSDGENEIIKKKGKMPIIAIAVVAVIIVAAVIAVVVSSGSDNNADKESKKETPAVTTDNTNDVSNEQQSKPSEEEKEDFEIADCVGIWYSEEAIDESKTPYDMGGYELKIYSVEDNKILFSVAFCQTPPASRIAQAEYIEAEVDDQGIVKFQYSDDGWGNSGEGQLTLGADNIGLSMNITNADANAMWSLNGNANLKKSTDEIPDESVDLLGLIGRDYYDIINVIDLKEIGSEATETGMNHFLEKNITINEETGLICSVYIDYSTLNSYDRGNIKFSDSINGNSTYEDIAESMGEITYTEDYNGENITCFTTKETLFNTYLKVTFADGKIKNILYFVPIT